MAESATQSDHSDPYEHKSTESSERWSDLTATTNPCASSNLAILRGRQYLRRPRSSRPCESNPRRAPNICRRPGRVARSCNIEYLPPSATTSSLIDPDATIPHKTSLSVQITPPLSCTTGGVFGGELSSEHSTSGSHRSGSTPEVYFRRLVSRTSIMCWLTYHSTQRLDSTDCEKVLTGANASSKLRYCRHGRTNDTHADRD